MGSTRMIAPHGKCATKIPDTKIPDTKIARYYQFPREGTSWTSHTRHAQATGKV
jgi:hypothetical protein